MDLTSSATSLVPLAHAVIDVFEKKEPANHEPKILVNRFVSEIASWYEKLRNAMDLQDDSVILKNAIERILKRRLLLGGTGEKVAEPLLRELVWARYFPDNALPQSLIHKTAETINNYLDLKHKILEHHTKFSEKVVNEWISQLMSCQISLLLAPNKEKEAMSNFMFHIMKDGIEIMDDKEDTKNVQVYLAVRRAFAKDDLAFLRFYLFQQIFPHLTHATVDEIAKAFTKGYKEIQYQLNYKLKEKIYVNVKRQTPVFFILEDVLKTHKGRIHALLSDPDAFGKVVLEACDKKYRTIKTRVRNAIIRSVFFLLLTKVIVAYIVEGTYDNFIYGHIMWGGFAINVVAPPLLMIIVSFFIKTPDKNNSLRIYDKIKAILYEEHPRLAPKAILYVNPPKGNTILKTVFTLLWMLTFGLSFGLMIWLLHKFNFNIVSQGVFIFFITIVSFLSYRINLTAHEYSVDAKQSLLTPFIDILFLPIISVGMRLTDGISQINILIYLFDFIIEAPFKVIFNFFEQLFSYLHAKREDLE